MSSLPNALFCLICFKFQIESLCSIPSPVLILVFVLRLARLTVPSAERKLDGRQRYCRKCRKFKPDRAHHCKCVSSFSIWALVHVCFLVCFMVCSCMCVFGIGVVVHLQGFLKFYEHESCRLRQRLVVVWLTAHVLTDVHAL